MNPEIETFRNNDSAEINIRSMLFYVLLRWKKILVCLIIGAILGSAVSFVQMLNNKPENIAKRIEKINTESSGFSMERVRQVADYQKMYDAQVARDEESYLSKLDPSKVYSITSSYYVFSNEKNIDVIDTVLENMLNRNDEWQHLWEVSGEFCSKNAFMELIDIKFDQPENPEKVNVENGDSHARGGVLNISASLPDETSRTAVGDYLHQLALATLEELGKNYPDSFSFIEVSNTVYYGFSQDISDTIKLNAEKRKTLLENLNNLQKSLSSDEKAYYNYHFTSDQGVSQNTVGFSKKNPIIGALLLVLLSLFWYAISYIFDRHFKDKKDSVIAGLPVLGEIKAASTPKKGIDHLILAAASRGKNLLEDPQYLESVISRMPDKIMLSGNLNDSDVAKLLAELSEHNDNLIISGSLSSDSDAVRNLSAVESVILILHTMKDYRDEIKMAVNTIHNTGKQISGVIIIQ